MSKKPVRVKKTKETKLAEIGDYELKEVEYTPSKNGDTKVIHTKPIRIKLK